MSEQSLSINGHAVSLAEFYSAITHPTALSIDDNLIAGLHSAHEHVLAAANSDKAVYGLNTGLGANLGHRLAADEITNFQLQIIAGRAVACGEPLPSNISRGVLLSRILSAASGYTGISPALFSHLCAIYNSGLAPVIPEFGSIGASDLTQNAHMGLSVCGLAPLWCKGQQLDADNAFSNNALERPTLQPKDGMVLVNHSGVTVSLSAVALFEARIALDMAKQAIVLSYVGYDANQQIFNEATNALRRAPGQQAAAAWFVNALTGSINKPRRIQEALSFRTIATIIGAAEHALTQAITTWESEANGVPDSPVILPDGTMQSTTNFHSPALALALQQVSHSLVGVANSSLQRMQRMMDPTLSGLPKYLTPIEGRSAGFVPSQKTALSLLAEISHLAMPTMMTPSPVSEAVEDMATMTPQAATKLSQQLKPFKLLIGLETLVACQAIDLRKQPAIGKQAEQMRLLIRTQIPMLDADRAIGRDINLASRLLEDYCKIEH